MHQPDLPSFPPETEDAAPALPQPSASAVSFAPTSAGTASDAPAFPRASSPISFLASTHPSPSLASNPFGTPSQTPTAAPLLPTSAQQPAFTFGPAPTAKGGQASQSATDGAYPSSQPVGGTAAAGGTHQPSTSAISAAQSLLGQAASSLQAPQPSQVTAAEFLSATRGAGTPGPSIPGIMNGPTLQQGPAVAGPSISQPGAAPQVTGPALEQSVDGPTPARSAANGSANSFPGLGGAQSSTGFSFGPAPTTAGGLPGGFTFGSSPAPGATPAAANAQQGADVGAAASSAASSAAFTFGSTGTSFHAARSLSF